MRLSVRPLLTDLYYRGVFSELLADLLGDEATKALVVKLVKSYGLSLSSFKFDKNNLSNDFIHFSKLEDTSWFDVSYGLEQVTATLRNPKNREQVYDLYFKLADCLKTYPMKTQDMNIQRQLAVDGDVESFLKSLNPKVPAGFEGALSGRGVFYTLKFPDQEFRIHITLTGSLFIPGGLFLSVENQFSPNKYSFDEAFEIARGYHEFILKELGIEIKGA